MFRYPRTPKTTAMDETSRTSNFQLRLPTTLVQRPVSPELSSGLGIRKLRHFTPDRFRLHECAGLRLVAENRQVLHGNGKDEKAEANDGKRDRDLRPLREIVLTGRGFH